MNHKKLRRLYGERLQVRRRTCQAAAFWRRLAGRKRALGTRTPMASPQGPNQL